MEIVDIILEYYLESFPTAEYATHSNLGSCKEAGYSVVYKNVLIMLIKYYYCLFLPLYIH